MTDNQKKELAVFRFGIICEFVTGVQLDYGEKELLLQQKCVRKWMIPIPIEPDFPEAPF